MLLCDVDEVRHLCVRCGCIVGKGVPVLGRGLWCSVPGVVNGVQGRFVSATEMIIGVNRLDVESEEFSFLMSNDEGYGGVGAEDIPEDIAEKSKYGSESIKGENEEENADHTVLVLVRDPLLWP